MGILSFALKTYVVGGTIYFTKQVGVWGNSTKTTELYNEIGNKVEPHYVQLMSYVPFDAPKAPVEGEFGCKVKHYYNLGVKNTIHTIIMLPCYVGQWTKKGVDAVKSALDAPPPAN